MEILLRCTLLAYLRIHLTDSLHRLTFRYVFIPYLQCETDAWVHLRNWTKRRADRKKILPNKIPMLVIQKPHLYGTADYKVVQLVSVVCIVS